MTTEPRLTKEPSDNQSDMENPPVLTSKTEINNWKPQGLLWPRQERKRSGAIASSRIPSSCGAVDPREPVAGMMGGKGTARPKRRTREGGRGQENKNDEREDGRTAKEEG